MCDSELSQRQRRPRRARALVLLAATFTLTCGGPKHTQPSPGTTAGAGGTLLVASSEPGLDFRVSEAAGTGPAYVPVPRAPATKLDDAAARAVLARLTPIPEAVQQAFAFRKRSLPPPRTGETIKGQFPPPFAGPPPPAETKGPVTVQRWAPEGDVPLAPHVAITFSQPMVAVSSQAETQKTVPARLEPAVPGQWRWVGTRTLLFEPDKDQHGGGRFPMATTYRVTVPEGVKSATGNALGKAVTWTFTTPPPKMQGYHPSYGPQRLDPVMFLAFDQKIDPDAVLGALVVKAGGKRVDVRRATAEELGSDEQVAQLAEAAEEGRWLAFKPEVSLPPATSIEVVIPKGTPSAEGPDRTAADQSFTFSTYGEFNVERWECAWGAEDCPPFTPFQIYFTNPVDAEKFDPAMVRVEPEIPGMKTALYGQTLVIQGRTKGRTTYTVRLAASVPDQFGQTLGDSKPMEFKVSSAPPMLTAQGNGFVVLDPAAGPKFSVYSINQEALRVRAYRVQPDDWKAWTAYMRDFQRDDLRGKPPGRLLIEGLVPVKGTADELTETPIDLTKALSGEHGHVAVIVEPKTQPKERWQRQYVQAWIQATDVGLTAFDDGESVYAWATDLATGAPLSGIDVSLAPGGATAKTDASGLVRLPLTSDKRHNMLLAKRGGDVAMLVQDSSWWSSEGNWTKRGESAYHAWYVADDRQMYKPGETVTVKGWIRKIQRSPTGDVAAADVGKEVGWKLYDSRGNEVRKGTTNLVGLTGFSFTFDLPDDMNLGYAMLQLDAKGGNAHSHAIQVQEFRRPEYEVTTEVTGAPHVVGTSATVGVSAAYYAGGPLQGADVRWDLTSMPGHFVPPNRDEYTFGFWVPWWGWYGRGEGGGDDPEGNQPKVKELVGKTDGAGEHHVEIAFVGVKPPRPMSLTAQASVTDVNRQTWASTASLLVHPSLAYVGLKSERYFVQAGQPLDVDAIAVDLDGKGLTGREIEMVSVRLDWEQVKGEWKEVEKDAETCRVASKGETPVRCTFRPKEGGTYRITAIVTDDKGRANETRIMRWVAGGKQPPKRDVEQEKLILVPGKQEYAAGETAEILVMAPWPGGEGIVTLRRDGMVGSPGTELEFAL